MKRKADQNNFNGQENGLNRGVKKEKRANQIAGSEATNKTIVCPYLHTINRQVLDFDLEKVIQLFNC